MVAAQRLLAKLDAEEALRAEKAKKEAEIAAAEEGAGNVVAILDYPDPVAYFREVLGIEPWTRQEEILRAVAAHSRVAVRSGHKISKSNSAAGLALWWYESHPRALVVMTSSSDFQVENILWEELKRLARNALRPIGGKLHESHRSGLVSGDGRKILGLSTKRTENMGGFSGPETLFIVDEASGVDEAIFSAIEGNRAGGARVVMFGNPTALSGSFYAAFHDAQQFWHPIHVSSEEAARYQEQVRRIPGLATQLWVDEKLKEWGPDSPLYDIRVRGDFPRQGTNVVIGLALVEAALRRWRETSDDGPLELGVDVARFGDDETIIQPRRGRKALPAVPLRSMDGPDVAGHVLELVRSLRRGTKEKPRVKVDVIGVGASVFDSLARMKELVAVAVNVGESATAEPAEGEPGFVRLRDQIWFAARDWLRDGGALPEDAQRDAELVAPTYGFDVRGQYKVESKDEIKKRLKRSPDRADALCLAVYNPPIVETTMSKWARAQVL